MASRRLIMLLCGQIEHTKDGWKTEEADGPGDPIGPTYSALRAWYSRSSSSWVSGARAYCCWRIRAKPIRNSKSSRCLWSADMTKRLLSAMSGICPASRPCSNTFLCPVPGSSLRKRCCLRMTRRPGAGASGACAQIRASPRELHLRKKAWRISRRGGIILAESVVIYGHTSMNKSIKAGKRRIGHGEPVFVVAELSGNHNGDIGHALRIIDAAADAGADAIKLQTYTPDTITLDSDRPEFVVKSANRAWRGKTLYQLYREAATPWAWHKKLFAHARKRGLVCFSSPFDTTAVDLLEKLGAPLYKVASFEVVDIPLLERIGRTRKPVIMSRGMATLEELYLAVKTLKKFGTK